MISRIDIYNYVASAVDTTERPVYCNARLEVAPEYFPACYIIETGSASEQQNYTLDFLDEQVRRDFEVQVFSNLENGGIEQATSIMDDVRAAFRRLYFIENFVGRTDNIDPAVIRITGRFHRVIGGDDQMPVGE
jgi:hypothetical protein